jgi:hypothetical protein
VKEIRNELRAMIALLPASLQTLSAGMDVDGTVTVDEMDTSMRIQNVHDGAIARVRYRRFTESMVLEPWVELAVLTLIGREQNYEAHLVARGEKTGAAPVHRNFALAGATPMERMDTARAVLACVEGMYRAARSDVPPYFERASFVLATDGERKAENALDTDLQYSAASAYFFGDADPEVVFGERASAGDYQHLGLTVPAQLGGRAALYAHHVWGAFAATTVSLTSDSGSAGDGGDEDGGDE